jgi:hypothetical protein
MGSRIEYVAFGVTVVEDVITLLVLLLMLLLIVLLLLLVAVDEDVFDVLGT